MARKNIKYEILLKFVVKSTHYFQIDKINPDTEGQQVCHNPAWQGYLLPRREFTSSIPSGEKS